MVVGGLDFETSGRDPKVHSVVEAGLVLWDTELRRPVRSEGFLVYDPEAVWEEGAVAVNGITQERCNLYGLPAKDALGRVVGFYQQADVLCAHNGTAFDRPFYENWGERMGRAEPGDQGKVWIDTMVDIPYPKEWSVKLKYLAAEHGILHYRAHGALSDAMVMLEILDRWLLEQVLESARSPTITVRALVSYDDRDKAKALGYHWRPIERWWVKPVKAFRLEDEEAEAVKAGFAIRQVNIEGG